MNPSLLGRVWWVPLSSENHEWVKKAIYEVKVWLSLIFIIYLHHLTYNDHSIHLSSSISDENRSKPERIVLKGHQTAHMRETKEYIWWVSWYCVYWSCVSRNPQVWEMSEEILRRDCQREWKWSEGIVREIIPSPSLSWLNGYDDECSLFVWCVVIVVNGSYLDGFHFLSHSKLLSLESSDTETAHTPTAVWEQRGVGSIPAKRTREKRRKREKKEMRRINKIDEWDEKEWENEIDKKNDVGGEKKETKRTVPGLRTWSPTVLLTRPDEIWLPRADGMGYSSHCMTVHEK